MIGKALSFELVLQNAVDNLAGVLSCEKEVG
jgi:hypothetical protein